nr:MAG: DNA polymerase [unidentified adenovirus]
MDSEHHIKITYHRDVTDSLTNFLILNQSYKGPIVVNTKKDLLDLQFQQVSIYNCRMGSVTIEDHYSENVTYSFFIKVLNLKQNLHLIKNIIDVEKCRYCGSFYKNTHTCSARRRDYYFHQVHGRTKQWWKKISFFPIGAIDNCKRLFITYDIETYTWHGSFGKQLVPFLLVFHLSGDEHLVNIALHVAIEQQWEQCRTQGNIFYALNPQKKIIGLKFRKFRETIQEILLEEFWKNFIDSNPTKMSQILKKSGVEDMWEIPKDFLEGHKFAGEPIFYEVYVIGHNINGFDEIVLAAQVLNANIKVPKGITVKRNFLPRNGKILFNDILFYLPNPVFNFDKENRLQFWKQGSITQQDVKCQFVKFMVRDTYALTHTSLRKAAEAYNLTCEKGHCPYKAVNEFFMLGSYQRDEEGFPHRRYWADSEEYEEVKRLWTESGEKPYDLIKQTVSYCIQDVIVTSKLVHELQLNYSIFVNDSCHLHCDFNVFQRPTISANSQAIFKQLIFSTLETAENNLGDEVLAPSSEMYDFVRESIRGGRCYPTYVGHFEKPLYVYDICGMYASALTHPMPAGRPLNPVDRCRAVSKYISVLAKKQKISYFDTDLLPGIFIIDADPPMEDFLDVLPPFCTKKGGRLCWTNEPLRSEICTSIDTITLHNRGWTVRILTDERTTVFENWKCIAKSYVQLNIAAKEQAEKQKNNTQRSIAKLLSNSLYGSFATRIDNKKVVFADQITADDLKAISNGECRITATNYIENENLTGEILPAFSETYSPINARTPLENEGVDTSNETSGSARDLLYTKSDTGSYIYNYKPITFLESEESEMCVQILEQTDTTVTNNRYPSHIASFVLAWTRAFISEWSDFLYSEDRGIPWEQRQTKSVYGDTDSLFLTEEGRYRLETEGKLRLKKHNAPLVFDENKKCLTWAVECETKCSNCGSDAYCPETIFLAPKLYALKEIVCPKCEYVSPGKLRAKGHDTQSLSFDILLDCYQTHSSYNSKKFTTSRKSIKKTLTSKNKQDIPFTVTETVLTRTLRPWTEPTLRYINDRELIPYSKSHPNPRNTDHCWMEIPWTQ